MALRNPRTLMTLVRIRKRQEDQRAQSLSAARVAVAAAENELRTLHEEQQRTLEQAGALARDQFDADDVRRYYQYERHVARLAVSKDAEVHKLAGVAEHRRRELEEAMKKRRMVEKLEERASLDLLQEHQRLEQRLLDEVAVNMAAARVRAGGLER